MTQAMTDTRTDTPSVVERTRPVTAGAPVVAAHSLGDTAVFVLGEEALLFVGKDGAERRVPIHGGAILAAASDGDRIITGGDDGKVVSTGPDGESAVIATDAKRRWIDHVAVGPNDTIAWSAGKQAFARSGKGAERVLEMPSTVGGLAFAPKGVRLAIAHYNGVTLWFPNAQTEPERLEWKGSHLGATMSPDGKFVVSSMQESMLHGWRISDHKDMRMSGYGARVRSVDWTVGGKWLATSGSNQLILWPFQGKDGPMGKTPRILAPAGSTGRGRRLPPQAGGGGGRLCRRARAHRAHRRRRRGFGTKARRRTDQRAGLEPYGQHARGRNGGRRRRRHRALIMHGGWG